MLGDGQGKSPYMRFDQPMYESEDSVEYPKREHEQKIPGAQKEQNAYQSVKADGLRIPKGHEHRANRSDKRKSDSYESW